MNISNRLSVLAARAAAIVITTLAAACGGGGGGGGSTPTGTGNPPPVTYSVGGNISGLSAAGLVLLDNGGDSSTQQSGATTFTFPTKLADASQYAVTVGTQPSNETCTVANGTGTVGSANVTNVSITCAANQSSVGGTVTGLTTTGLVLQDNGGNNLAVPANATSFTFSAPVADGSPYAVTVAAQPATETCQVGANGSGTVGSTNVTNVAITCTVNTVPSQTIGGTISGLTAAGLVLQDNGGDNRAVSANATTFLFATPVADGSPYAVTIATQPANETCQVAANGSGTVGSTNVTNVSITCAVNQYSVGGTVMGLTTGGLVLQDNGGNNLAVPANAATFTFSALVANGSPYAVTIAAQPATETCQVAANGSGTVGSTNIVNVSITCALNQYSVGGTVTGLTGATGLVLADNNTDMLTVMPPAGGGAQAFKFNTTIPSGGAYKVTIKTQPTNQAQLCTVTGGGSGNVATADITNVAISCVNVGRFVFVANRYDGNNGDVSAFTINPTTGALTAATGSPFLADGSPTSVVVDTTGQFVYVGNKATLDVTAFELDPTTGILTFKSNYFSTHTEANALSITPSDGYLFATGGGLDMPGAIFPFSLNTQSGALTGLHLKVDLTQPPPSSAIDPTGQYLFVPVPSHFIGVYAIGTDGSLTPTAQTTTVFQDGPSNPGGNAVWPGGTAAGGFLYVSSQATLGSVGVFSYDSTGTLALLSTAPAGGATRGLAIDPAGKYLYAANYNDGTISAYSINAQTGALTSVGADVPTGNLNSVANPGPTNLMWDPSGQWLYCTNYLDGSISVFTASSGVLTLVGTVDTVQTNPTGASPLGIAVY